MFGNTSTGLDRKLIQLQQQLLRKSRGQVYREGLQQRKTRVAGGDDGDSDLVALQAGDGVGCDGFRSDPDPRHRQRRRLVRPRPGGPQSAPESRRTRIRRKGQIVVLLLLTLFSLLRQRTVYHVEPQVKCLKYTKFSIRTHHKQTSQDR